MRDEDISCTLIYFIFFSFVSKPYCLLHFYIFFLIQVANEYNIFRGDGLDLYRRSLKKKILDYNSQNSHSTASKVFKRASSGSRSNGSTFCTRWYLPECIARLTVLEVLCIRELLSPQQCVRRYLKSWLTRWPPCVISLWKLWMWLWTQKQVKFTDWRP